VGVVLELRTGPLAGKTISLSSSQSILIGRAAERAQFAVPHDSLMSGVHFAMECGPNGCRVIDKKSTNGTFLNGAKIREPMLLANGDEIKSGQTVFVVRIAPDDKPRAISASPQVIGQVPVAVPYQAPASANKTSSPTQANAPARAPAAATPASTPSARPSQPPALAIGSWVFHKIPDRWQIQEGLGIQQIVKDAFASSIGVMEEPLGPGITLMKYIEAQTLMFRESLQEPRIDAVAAPVITGSEETAAIEIRFTIKDGPSVFFRRVYVRGGSGIGVLTLTTLEKDLASVRPIYDSALAGISFSRKE